MARSYNSNMWRKTIILTTAMIVIGFGLIIGNLVRWQLVRGEELRSKAIDQSLRSTELTPMRGTVYDVTGKKVLAQSASVWTVVLEPNYIKDGDEVKIASGLARILDLDYEEVLEKTHRNSYFVYVKRKVETEVRDEIEAMLKDQGVKRGVEYLEDYKRYYPYGTTASTVLGFTGTDNQGLAGVETQYEDELSGTTGRLVSARNAVGKDMPFQYDQYIEAADGYDLVLTIDETVQSIVEKHLEVGCEAYGALEGGTAIVMDVNTGAIIALSTKGDYNPNDPFSISEAAEAAIPGLVQAEIERLLVEEQKAMNSLKRRLETADTEEERAEAEKAIAEFDVITAEDLLELNESLYNKYFTEAQNRQWRNKAVSDTYYPGSVFKMVTAAMALEEGVVTENSTYTCEGFWDFHLPDVKPINCWKHAPGHGLETLVDGVCNSCNPYMIWLGQKLGRNTFYNYFDAFGLTEKTGIDLPGESGSLYYTVDELNVTELATESFGQNFAITPIQMCTAMCAVANGGYLVQPHVVDRMLDSEGNIVQKTDTTYKRQVISEDVSERVTKILLRNATSESGKNGYVPGFRIAGKTGTSEKIAQYVQDLAQGLDPDMQYIVSYGGYAPADDPKYALLVFFDEPQIGTPSGGAQAGPIFAAIMEEILPYLGVDPQYTEAEYENLAAVTPNVVNRTVNDAQAILREAGFGSFLAEYTGNDAGNRIVYAQVPSPGSPIPKDGFVALYLKEPDTTKYVKVPKFTGYTLADCRYYADLADVQIVLYGGGREGYAQTQSIEAGTMVKRGTVIKVSFITSEGVETAPTD
ncbi:MAG: PASTA domain-containing protein [Clostridia bacterium]|nr:PASTA domain-containing protein [Clostridia bacterium]